MHRSIRLFAGTASVLALLAATLVYGVGVRTPVGPGNALEWRHLGPELVLAVDRAEVAARAAAEADLAAWHVELMQRVDVEFIPWQDDYIRARVTERFIWVKDWVTNLADSAAADRAAADRMTAAFSQRVIEAQAMRERLQQIAMRSAAVFRSELAKSLEQYQLRLNVPAAAFEAALGAVEMARPRGAGDEVADRLKLKLTKYAIGHVPLAGTAFNAAENADLLVRAYTNWSDLSAIDFVDLAAMARDAALVAAKGKLAVAGAAATAKAIAAGKLTVATGGLAGLVIAAGVVGYDAYDHNANSVQRRQAMRVNAEAMLSAALGQPLSDHGTIRVGLANMGRAVRDGIEAQMPMDARFVRHARQFLGLGI